MNVGDPWEWFMEIPVVSRVYLTASFLTTAACALEIISPFTLYFNYKLIYEKGQIWRLATNFLFFGMFSIDYLLHMYFLVRYCRLLEENSFRARTADFVCLMIFGCAMMMLIAPFVNIPFFGSSLSFMMVYIWGRRNRFIRMSFLGLFPFTAPYLPWVLLSVSLFLGNSVLVDMIGIAVGHLYFFLDDIFPQVADIRGWQLKHPLRTPQFIYVLLGYGHTVVVDGSAVTAAAGGFVLNQPVIAVPAAAEEEEVTPEPAAGDSTQQDAVAVTAQSADDNNDNNNDNNDE